MRVDTKKREKARKGFEQMYRVREFAARMFHILQTGKRGLDSLHMELGAMLCKPSWILSGKNTPGRTMHLFIKALKYRFGAKFIHQRCTIHKDRNIQRHFAKKYRKEAHRRFKTALEQNSYDDASRKIRLDSQLCLTIGFRIMEKRSGRERAKTLSAISVTLKASLVT